MTWTARAWSKAAKGKGKTGDQGTSPDWRPSGSTDTRPPWARNDQPAQPPQRNPVGQGVSRWKIDEEEKQRRAEQSAAAKKRNAEMKAAKDHQHQQQHHK